MGELKKKLTKFERAKLSSKGIVIKKTKPDGTTSYQGGPLLRGTQVYPRKFAAKLYQLHKKLKAWKFCKVHYPKPPELLHVYFSAVASVKGMGSTHQLI